MDTIESVLKQTEQDFECIIVDDGSNDANILRNLVLGLNDNRFNYIWQENGGGGSARNNGIINASGRYISFLDSDDIFLPEKLEICKRHLDKNPLHAIYSRMYVDRGSDRMWIRPDRAIHKDEGMGEYLFVANQFIQTSTIVLHAQTAKEVLFDPQLRKGQDLDFCLRLHRHNVRFHMIEDPLTIWVDKTEEGRTSRTKGYKAPLEWLERSKHLMSPEAQAGYRATVLFYYMAKEKPLQALQDLWAGKKAGVPLKVLFRQFLRGFLPNFIYRKLVNSFVAAAGKKTP